MALGVAKQINLSWLVLLLTRQNRIRMDQPTRENRLKIGARLAIRRTDELDWSNLFLFFHYAAIDWLNFFMAQYLKTQFLWPRPSIYLFRLRTSTTCATVVRLCLAKVVFLAQWMKIPRFKFDFYFSLFSHGETVQGQEQQCYSCELGFVTTEIMFKITCLKLIFNFT